MGIPAGLLALNPRLGRGVVVAVVFSDLRMEVARLLFGVARVLSSGGLGSFVGQVPPRSEVPRVLLEAKM